MNKQLAEILEAFRERCAVECDKEKGYAETRLDDDRLNHRESWQHAEHRGQQRSAYWCAKHVREIDVGSWLRAREVLEAKRPVDWKKAAERAVQADGGEPILTASSRCANCGESFMVGKHVARGAGCCEVPV